MKVLFVAQNLNVGGIQTSLLNTIKKLSEENKDFKIDLFAFSSGELLDYFPEDIRIIKGKKLLNLLLTPIKNIKESKKYIDLFLRYLLILSAKIVGVETLYRFLLKFEKLNTEYDVAISYFNDVPGGYSNKGTTWYVADYVNAKKKIAWIHINPEKAHFDRNMCLKQYKNIDWIVCVSEAVRNKFNKLVPEYAHKTVVVYNIFPIEEILMLSNEYKSFEKKENVFDIITVGRIDNTQKRMDRIIKVCRLLKENNVNNFKWRIVGDGPDLKLNEQLSRENGTDDVIEFVGNKKNPYPYVKNSDLFVLTSDYEGYPMVIGEAMILGVPVVTTSFAAASEMIENNINGIICPMQAEEIYKTIFEMINYKENYEKFKSNCLNNLNINTKWNEQISQIL